MDDDQGSAAGLSILRPAMKISAAVCRGPNVPLSIETLELDAPRDEEVLVRVVATGVCHTDIVVRDGHLPTPPPVVLGHEGAGVVERVGSKVSNVAPGDHVVMTFNSCGRCASCIESEPTYCHEFFPRNFFAARADGSSALSKNGERINGNFFGQSSFATYALCHERNAIRVPKESRLELLGPLACGVQTGAGAVMNALRVTPGKSFAVFGVGSVGLSAIMAAKVVGATTIIAVDVNDARLSMAKELGATHAFDSRHADAAAGIQSLTGGGVQFALDTTGLMPVIRTAVESLAPRGTCGMLGASPPGSEIGLDAVHFMSGGRRLIGIVEGASVPEVFIPMLIRLHAQGRLPFDRMVKLYTLDQINEAMRDSEMGKTIKPILRIG
jgi:aryl-alcohol dehydrogenase